MLGAVNSLTQKNSHGFLFMNRTARNTSPGTNLRKPHGLPISKVFDAGMSDLGRPGFVMELVQSSSTSSSWRLPPLNWSDAAGGATKACCGGGEEGGWLDKPQLTFSRPSANELSSCMPCRKKGGTHELSSKGT